MRIEVQRDLDASATAFERLAWPAIAPLIGGGRFVSLENRSDATAKLLDQQAGFDALQIIDDGSMCGLACRMQPTAHAWDTFTIRHSRKSGTITEYAKRLVAIHEKFSGYLVPRWTVQGYYNKAKGGLISVAAVNTHELMIYIYRDLQKPEASRRTEIKPNGSDGNTFLVASWANLADDGVPVKVWCEQWQQRSAA